MKLKDVIPVVQSEIEEIKEQIRRLTERKSELEDMLKIIRKGRTTTPRPKVVPVSDAVAYLKNPPKHTRQPSLGIRKLLLRGEIWTARRLLVELETFGVKTTQEKVHQVMKDFSKRRVVIKVQTDPPGWKINVKEDPSATSMLERAAEAGGLQTIGPNRYKTGGAQ